MRIYNGTPVRDVLLDKLDVDSDNAFLIYIMGAYSSLDPNLHLVIDDSNADTDDGIDASQLDVSLTAGSYELDREMIEHLYRISDNINNSSDRYSFLAVDVDIPPTQDVRQAFLELAGEVQPPDDKQPFHEQYDISESDTVSCMTVLQQSKAFAEASDAVIFHLPEAGYRDGVTTEMGAVLEAMNLDIHSQSTPIKHPDRFHVFHDSSLQSYTVNSITDEYRVGVTGCDSPHDFLENIRKHIFAVETKLDAGWFPDTQTELENTPRIDVTDTLTQETVLDN